MTNNTLHMLETLKAQIARIESELAKVAPASVNAAAEDSLMKALHARGGNATVSDLMTDCSMTKGTAWRHINSLERQAKVWLRVTHRADGRKHTVVYHADHVAA